MRNGVDLVPQRLGCDHHAVTTKDAFLARERNVVLVLVNHHLDAKVQRVTSAWGYTLRADRRLDAAATFAGVLLLLHLDELVADVDDIDHLGRLELPLHRLELPAATRTSAVSGVEFEELLFVLQFGLGGGPELLP